MVQTYVDYMTKVAKLLGTKCNTKKKMREIMDFESKLAKVGGAFWITEHNILDVH